MRMYSWLVPHPSAHHDVARPLDPDETDELAEVARLLGTPSRLRLLFALVPGERTVDELARLCEMEQPAVSHQLRLLRQGRLVGVRRSGRHAYYRHFDHHVSELLAALRHHREHLDAPPAGGAPVASAEAAG